MGADQAVSSHLRGWLVTTVQELLRTEHVAGVGSPVHAVQDVDLRREGLVGTHVPPQVQLHLSAAPQLPLPHPPPGPEVRPAATSIPTTYPFQSTLPWRVEVAVEGWRPSGYLHDELIAGVTTIHL